MGLQGDKATHDFLSLYTTTAKDSALPLLHESNKAPPSQGFFLKTHDFLQPLERPSSQSPTPPPQQQHAGGKQLHARHALPGGVGTFSVSRAAADHPAGAVVKQEQPPFAALWGQPDPRGHPWSLPFAASCIAVASARPQQQQQGPPERKLGGGGFMDTGSRSSGGAGFDDDDGLAARREVSSSLKELSVRVETKGGSCSGSAGTDHLPNTPRSKHSATEQRRRSKINDRFQILREILPQIDQKRDKASFLLEVIEYIRFLQEKVQKYEVSHQEWNQENTRIMPWSNVFFRSSWKNAQNKDEINGDKTSDSSEVIKNGSTPGFPFASKPVDYNNANALETASDAQKLAVTNPKDCASYKEAETPTVANHVGPQQPAQLTKSSPTEDSAANSGMLANPELAIDEGTISLSSQYSQGLLSTLNHALQNSGIDLSQASISVQINLGRATKGSAPGANSTSKEVMDQAPRDQATRHQLRSADGVQEHPRATKRHKSDR